MAFAISCPECSARFRSSKERPIGAGVECSKCGAQFYITADNQTEWREGPPALPPNIKKSRSKDDPDQRPSRDDNDVPKSNRRSDDDDEDFVAKPKPKGKGKFVVVAGVLGLLMLIGIGLGAYFLFFDASGRSAADKVRQPTELQMDMFAYVPEPANYVKYIDIQRAKDLNDASGQIPLDGFFPNLMQWKKGLRYICATSSTSLNSPTRVLLSYESPVDLSTYFGDLKLAPLPGALSRVHVGNALEYEYTIFQPAPTKVYVMRARRSNKSEKPSEKMLEELLAVDPNSSLIPSDVADGMKAVSGYPNVSYSKWNDRELPHQIFTGSASILGSGLALRTEKYTILQFATEADAKSWWKRPDEEPKPSKDARLKLYEKYRWAGGNRLFYFLEMQHN